MSGKIAERVENLALDDYRNQAYPVTLWDVFFGKYGHPVRTTISKWVLTFSESLRFKQNTDRNFKYCL